jgi:hypothetical protein
MKAWALKRAIRLVQWVFLWSVNTSMAILDMAGYNSFQAMKLMQQNIETVSKGRAAKRKGYEVKYS